MEVRSTRNKIELFENNTNVGFVSFTVKGSVMEIEHTIVYQEYRGLGYAFALMKEVLKMAKDYSYKVRPICSYAVKWFSECSECTDILV
jgi:predicted GNAT family acetyltransferase